MPVNLIYCLYHCVLLMHQKNGFRRRDVKDAPNELYNNGKRIIIYILYYTMHCVLDIGTHTHTRKKRTKRNMKTINRALETLEWGNPTNLSKSSENIMAVRVAFLNAFCHNLVATHLVHIWYQHITFHIKKKVKWKSCELEGGNAPFLLFIFILFCPSFTCVFVATN